MPESRLELPDVNVLIALTNARHVFHRQAHRWLGEVPHYATTPVTESGLVRLLLNPNVVGEKMAVQHALQVLHAVRQDLRAVFLVDDSSLASAQVSTMGLSGHKQVTDWHLLNLAAKHDAVLVTFDRKLAKAVGRDDSHLVQVLA